MKNKADSVFRAVGSPCLMHLWPAMVSLLVILSVPPLHAQEGDPGEPENEEEAASATRVESRSVRRLGDVVGSGSDDFSMAIPQIDMPVGPVSAQPEVSLPDAEMDNRLQNILTRRAFMPDDPDIEQELSDLLDQVEAQGVRALDAGDFALVERYIGVLNAFDADRPLIGRYQAEREREDEIQRLLGVAGQALESGNLLDPEEASARTLYLLVLELDAENAAAVAGLGQVTDGLFQRLGTLVDDSNFEAAEALLNRMSTLELDEEQLEQRRGEIAEARQDQQRQVIARTRAAIDEERYDSAEQLLNEAIGMGVPTAEVERLRVSLDDAMRYRGFEPGQLFQDPLPGAAALGPVMVVIPAGSFMMGSPDNEDDRLANEGPRHRVTLERGFALARQEVTVGQFRRFVNATGYETDAEREGASRIYMAGSGRIAERRGITWGNDYLGERAGDDLPVIHVSWNDAAAYAAWLAEQTNRGYRLSSEAEFEYALRAGTQTPYWWGEGSPDNGVENVTGDGDRFTDQRRWTVAFRRYTDGFWGPASVGSLEANPFGLYDMGGNVMEWVEDCWHDSYTRAPADGSAWVNPGCSRRVIRGASWSSTPAMSRSAFRLSSQPTASDARVGFRVARDL